MTACFNQKDPCGGGGLGKLCSWFAAPSALAGWTEANWSQARVINHPEPERSTHHLPFIMPPLFESMTCRKS